MLLYNQLALSQTSIRNSNSETDDYLLLKHEGTFISAIGSDNPDLAMKVLRSYLALGPVAHFVAEMVIEHTPADFLQRHGSFSREAIELIRADLFLLFTHKGVRNDWFNALDGQLVRLAGESGQPQI
jgi:hypothetical protein